MSIRLERLLLFLLLHFFVSNTSKISVLVSSYSLQGKRALVTGSSGGIGRGIALALAEEGCNVLVHYHVRREMAEATANEIQEILLRKKKNNDNNNDNNNDHDCVAGTVLQADFRDNAQIIAVMAQVDEIWPDGWDILVNNAGVISKMALEDDDDNLSTWYETLQVNLNAPRLLSRLAIKSMQKRGQGVLLQVSSIHGEKSNEYMSAYATSKAALEALTRSMAMEYAAYNIRANAVAPGVVVVERTAEAFAQNNATAAKVWTERMPIARLGQPHDVAAVALQMITSDWVTGAVWQVDGGIMARANLPQRPRPTLPSNQEDDDEQACKQ